MSVCIATGLRNKWYQIVTYVHKRACHACTCHFLLVAVCACVCMWVDGCGKQRGRVVHTGRGSGGARERHKGNRFQLENDIFGSSSFGDKTHDKKSKENLGGQCWMTADLLILGCQAVCLSVIFGKAISEQLCIQRFFHCAQRFFYYAWSIEPVQVLIPFQVAASTPTYSAYSNSKQTSRSAGVSNSDRAHTVYLNHR